MGGRARASTRRPAASACCCRPARLLRRRRPGGRHRREGARAATARRSTCASRSCTTSTSSRRCEQRGAIFVEETDEVPEGATVVFSAHGVAPGGARARPRARQLQDDRRDLPAGDQGAPARPRRFADDDYDILLIGHEGHEEVDGTAGEAPEHIQLVDGPDDVADVEVRDPEKVVWLSQTTLSVDETMETVGALRERFPQLQDPPSDDICYATQNRQVAVKQIAAECRPGDRRRLAQLVELGAAGRGRARGRRPRRAPRRRRRRDRRGLARRASRTVGVTSGASVPEVLVGERARLARRARLSATSRRSSPPRSA